MKVGLMGDNGFRAGHVNGNAAAAPALSTAEVFGQAAKIGRAVDDLGQDLMHKENVLRDDESFRMGLTNARGLIASAEQDIDNGAGRLFPRIGPPPWKAEIWNAFNPC